MVLAEITWPYGGREVFVSFSFSGWADLIPMIMTEDSGFFFRGVLPLGEHQYKFLVDGEWRYNDRVDFAQVDHGSINNYIVVEELPDMDIELPLLDSDVDVFRRCLSMHLASHTIFELMPPSGKVPVLAAEVAVKEAFHLMHEQGLAAVPIWDSNRHQISAMLTVSDFILILMELHRNYAMLTDEQLQVHTISAWKEGKHQPNGEPVGAAQQMFGRPVIRAGPDESLRDVAMRILQYKISTIPIIHSTEEESCPWLLLHVACLGGILKYMCRQFHNNLDYLPLLQHPVGSLSLGTWASEGGGARHFVALHPNKTLGFALNILLEENISSIPIVDGDGSLINIYSRSDITSLAKDDAYTRIQLDQTVISQVLELANGPNRYHTCTRFDPLYMVMERLSDPVVRRLIVIDAGSQHVEGIITLSDVFRFILN